MLKKKVSIIKFTAYVATSIDGRIAKSNRSGVNWTSKEDWDFFQKSLSQIDAVIVGHSTYNISKSRLNKRNTIVLTSKADKLKSFGSVTFLNPEKSDLIKFLTYKNYKKVAIVGGGFAYNFCLRNKMLDELFVTIEPYIFTAGVPMFAGINFKKYKFILESIRKLNKNGTLLLQYKNANQGNKNWSL